MSVTAAPAPVAALVTAYQRTDVTLQTLRTILNCVPPPAEVLVHVDGGAEAVTTAIRKAFPQAGGFSDFFLHRCTMNEDVDLGLKLSRVERIVLSPAARMAHMHAPAGRVSAAMAAEDDLHNRYLILRQTVGRSAPSAFASVLLYFVVETLGNIGGALRRRRAAGFAARLAGRVKALARILVPSLLETG